MAFVQLTTSGSAHLALDRMRQSAGTAKEPRHLLTENPEEADLIFFAENYTADFLLSGVAASPLVRRFRDKVFCFCENDSVIARFPGIYASLPKRYCHPRWAVTGPYLWMMREMEAEAAAIESADLLFSFIGSEYTHPVRKELMGLKHSSAHLEDVGSKTEYMRYQASESEKQAFRLHYDQILMRSKFVLCPRGMGCASIRLFETLRAGRVPVIISDDYSLPPGPDWESCSVKVLQGEVGSIPARLEALEPRAIELGQAARRTYEDWYSKQQLYTRVVDQCLAMKQAGLLNPWTSGLRTLNQLRQPGNVGTLQRMMRQKIRNRIKRIRHA
jgi:hypothetical protein